MPHADYWTVAERLHKKHLAAQLKITSIVHYILEDPENRWDSDYAQIVNAWIGYPESFEVYVNALTAHSKTTKRTLENSYSERISYGRYLCDYASTSHPKWIRSDVIHKQMRQNLLFEGEKDKVFQILERALNFSNRGITRSKWLASQGYPAFSDLNNSQLKEISVFVSSIASKLKETFENFYERWNWNVSAEQVPITYNLEL